MAFRYCAVGLIAAALAAGPASAQVVGLGTTKGGATDQISAAVSKVVSAHSEVQMRPEPMGGTQQYIPVVNAGELAFGLANMMQTWMAYTGTGLSEGNKYDNLRIAATMMRFQTGPLVANRSDIKKTSDLKGKRMPYGFRQAPLFQFVSEGVLANGGLGWDDVTKVPQVALRQHWDAIKQGKIDMVIGAAGTAAIQEMDSVIDGGIRYLSLDDSPEAWKRTQKILPRTYLTTLKPEGKLVGVHGNVNIITYDYELVVHKGVPDDTVYKVVKALHANEKELKESSPLWRSHSSAGMAKDQGMPYHPGAEKFYKEAGIWKR
ncbi:MAG: TAXI family TRAP transporter solute-binding subunit [Rhodospirillales bacterium]